MSLRSASLIRLIKEHVGTPKFGAEIGVFKGETSRDLLNEFRGLHMYLVDPWKAYPHKEMQGATQLEWDTLVEITRYNIGMGNNLHKCTIIREESSYAAGLIACHSLDFVFIDAKHDRPSVSDDIRMWLPKIRSGGLIAGHDYGYWNRGVKQAVNAAFGKERIMARAGKVWGVVVK